MSCSSGLFFFFFSLASISPVRVAQGRQAQRGHGAKECGQLDGIASAWVDGESRDWDWEKGRGWLSPGQQAMEVDGRGIRSLNGRIHRPEIGDGKSLRVASKTRGIEGRGKDGGKKVKKRDANRRRLHGGLTVPDLLRSASGMME